MNTPSLPSLLEDCIMKKYDFGTAYGHLRAVWYTEDWNTIWDKLCRCEAEDQEMRQKTVHGNSVINLHMYPQCVWDLYSNRVIPMWTTGKKYLHAISHAWVDENDHMDVWMPINGQEWPMPIPKDANLDLILIKMLNRGLEYMCLDVLCLRQQGGPREDLHAEEWKLVVPTIGWVYEWNKMQSYLSGLGQPLHVTEDYFDSDRCWFNHAWMLQEIGHDSYEICGVTPNGPLDAIPDMDGNYDTPILTTFHQKLDRLKPLDLKTFEVLEEMQHQVSTNLVDKIARLAILLNSNTIPAYYKSQSLEDAWTAFMNMASGLMQGDLFFFYPEPENAGATWQPSWNQVLEKSLSEHNTWGATYTDVWRHIGDNVNQFQGFCIENRFVQGLAVLGSPGTQRYGELLVEDTHRIQHVFNITAMHQHPIPEDMYTLIGPKDQFYLPVLHNNWVQCVVGQRLSDKSFKKLSVLTMAGKVARRMLDVTGREE